MFFGDVGWSVRFSSTTNHERVINKCYICNNWCYIVRFVKLRIFCTELPGCTELPRFTVFFFFFSWQVQRLNTIWPIRNTISKNINKLANTNAIWTSLHHPWTSSFCCIPLLSCDHPSLWFFPVILPCDHPSLWFFPVIILPCDPSLWSSFPVIFPCDHPSLWSFPVILPCDPSLWSFPVILPCDPSLWSFPVILRWKDIFVAKIERWYELKDLKANHH